MNPDTSTNSFFISAAQDYIISYCKPNQILDPSTRGGTSYRDRGQDPSRGQVHVSNILTGRCPGLTHNARLPSHAILHDPVPTDLPSPD